MFLNKLKRWIRWFFGFSEKPSQKDDFYPEVTVVIPAYNEAQCIVKTIEGIKAQTYPIKRIIVVDDCSEDQTGSIAADCGVEVIKTPQRSGTKARAQNYALPLVETELVATVDADTLLDLEAVARTVPYFTDPEVASVCSFVIPQKIETFWEKARFLQYLYYITLNKGAQNHWGVPLVSSGCFTVFNTKLLKQFNGFPDKTMAEDMDLTWRYLAAGKKIKLVSEAVCYPLDPSNFYLFRLQVSRWYRSFLQNISLHRSRLLKNKRLAFFIGFYLISGLVVPFFWALALWFFFRESKLAYLLLAFLVSDWGLSSAVILMKAWRLKKFKLALTSLPNFWLVGLLENYLFLESMWLEWIRKKRLANWQKGH